MYVLKMRVELAQCHHLDALYGQVSPLFFPLRDDSGDEAGFGKCLEHDVDDAGVGLCQPAQVRCRIWLVAVFHPLADVAQHHCAHHEAIALGHGGAFLREEQMVEVLDDVRQLCADEDDDPGELYPQHEERKSCKRSVDGVVARHPHLRMDIEILQHLHAQCGNEGRDKCIAPSHSRVGHECVQHGEDAGHDDGGHDVDAQFQQRADDIFFSHYLRHGCHPERHAGVNDNHDGQHEEHRHEVGEGPCQRTLGVCLPYIVEDVLDVARQHYDSPEHEDETEAEHYAALRVYEIRVDETDDDFHRLRLAVERRAEPRLDVFVVAETSRYGEYHRYDGHGGEESGVCEL